MSKLLSMVLLSTIMVNPGVTVAMDEPTKAPLEQGQQKPLILEQETMTGIQNALEETKQAVDEMSELTDAKIYVKSFNDLITKSKETRDAMKKSILESQDEEAMVLQWNLDWSLTLLNKIKLPDWASEPKVKVDTPFGIITKRNMAPVIYREIKERVQNAFNKTTAYFEIASIETTTDDEKNEKLDEIYDELTDIAKNYEYLSKMLGTGAFLNMSIWEQLTSQIEKYKSNMDYLQQSASIRYDLFREYLMNIRDYSARISLDDETLPKKRAPKDQWTKDIMLGLSCDKHYEVRFIDVKERQKGDRTEYRYDYKVTTQHRFVADNVTAVPKTTAPLVRNRRCSYFRRIHDDITAIRDLAVYKQYFENTFASRPTEAPAFRNKPREKIFNKFEAAFMDADEEVDKRMKNSSNYPRKERVTRENESEKLKEYATNAINNINTFPLNKVVAYIEILRDQWQEGFGVDPVGLNKKEAECVYRKLIDVWSTLKLARKSKLKHHLCLDLRVIKDAWNKIDELSQINKVDFDKWQLAILNKALPDLFAHNARFVELMEDYAEKLHGNIVETRRHEESEGTETEEDGI